MKRTLVVQVPNQEAWLRVIKRQLNLKDWEIQVIGQKDRIHPAVEVLITFYQVEKDLLDEAKHLKVVFIPYTGVNSQPLEALSERGIVLCNSHINAKYVAERAFGLALALLGRIPELDKTFRGGWGALGDRKWDSLFGKRVGILGMGEIGQALVALLRPFEPTIFTLERYRKYQINGLTYVSDVARVCEESELLFNLLPLTDQTRGIIDGPMLEKLKDGYLVNVGRGETMDEEALYQALKTRLIRGAAIDVWYQYGGTRPSAYPLEQFDHLVMSPHNGGINRQTEERAIKDTLDNLENYLTKRPLRNQIDHAGY